MGITNAELAAAKEQVIRKNRTESRLKDLYAQKTQLSDKVDVLRNNKYKEEKDVEQLMKGNLKGFFLELVGKKEEQLTKEKEEAYKAAMMYDMECQVLERLENEICSLEEEKRKLSGCEERYQRMFEEALKELRLAGTKESDELFLLEKKIYEEESTVREVEEAVLEGKKVFQLANEILEVLDDADGYCTWDILGGGLLADVLKHDALHKANEQLRELQCALHLFRNELADVKIDADFQLEIEGFLGFADYFFDGLFVDLAVQDRVEQNQDKMNKVCYKINAMLSDLDEKKKQAEQQLKSLYAEREKLFF